MKNKIGLWLVIPGVILAFAARLSQICAGTDMETGFLLDGNGFFMDFCFWGAVLLTLAGAIAAAIFDKKSGSAYYKTPVSGITDGRAAAIGFALLLPALGALYEGWIRVNVPEGSVIRASAFTSVIDFLFGIDMLVIAFFVMYVKKFTPALGFSLVGSAAFYTLRGIDLFRVRMAVATVPEYLINCISVICSGIFFMQLAKLLSGNEGKRTRAALTSVGAASASMILGNGLAVIAASLFGSAEVSSRIVADSYEAEFMYQAMQGDSAYFMTFMPAADFAVGIFIVATMIALYMKPRAEEPAEKAQPEDTGAQGTQEAE